MSNPKPYDRNKAIVPDHPEDDSAPPDLERVGDIVTYVSQAGPARTPRSNRKPQNALNLLNLKKSGMDLLNSKVSGMDSKVDNLNVSVASLQEEVNSLPTKDDLEGAMEAFEYEVASANYQNYLEVQKTLKAILSSINLHHGLAGDALAQRVYHLEEQLRVERAESAESKESLKRLEQLLYAMENDRQTSVRSTMDRFACTEDVMKHMYQALTRHRASQPSQVRLPPPNTVLPPQTGISYDTAYGLHSQAQAQEPRSLPPIPIQASQVGTAFTNYSRPLNAHSAASWSPPMRPPIPQMVPGHAIPAPRPIPIRNPVSPEAQAPAWSNQIRVPEAYQGDSGLSFPIPRPAVPVAMPNHAHMQYAAWPSASIPQTQAAPSAPTTAAGPQLRCVTPSGAPGIPVGYPFVNHPTQQPRAKENMGQNMKDMAAGEEIDGTCEEDEGSDAETEYVSDQSFVPAPPNKDNIQQQGSTVPPTTATAPPDPKPADKGSKIAAVSTAFALDQKELTAKCLERPEEWMPKEGRKEWIAKLTEDSMMDGATAAGHGDLSKGTDTGNRQIPRKPAPTYAPEGWTTVSRNENKDQTSLTLEDVEMGDDGYEDEDKDDKSGTSTLASADSDEGVIAIDDESISTNELALGESETANLSWTPPDEAYLAFLKLLQALIPAINNNLRDSAPSHSALLIDYRASRASYNARPYSLHAVRQSICAIMSMDVTDSKWGGRALALMNHMARHAEEWTKDGEELGLDGAIREISKYVDRVVGSNGKTVAAEAKSAEGGPEHGKMIL
ncbi:hypothetical protein IAR50_002655 [Cryptococcus sp. DSM 104548]